MPKNHSNKIDKITHVHDNTKKCKCRQPPIPSVDSCNQPYIVNGQLNVTAPPCLLQDREYTNLFNILSDKILTYRFDLLLAAVHNEVSYNRLLRAVRDAQKINGVNRYRYLLTHPNGNVVIDTNQPDNEPHNPRSNSYQHYINGTIDENHNTRPEIMRAQAEQGGVGYNETTELDTITKPRKKVAIRLGPHLNAQGTIRINLFDEEGFSLVQTIPVASDYSNVVVNSDGSTFAAINFVAGAGQASVYIYTNSSGSYVNTQTITVTTDIPPSLAISSDGSRIAITYTSNGSGFTTIYETATGTQLYNSFGTYTFSTTGTPQFVTFFYFNGSDNHYLFVIRDTQLIEFYSDDDNFWGGLHDFRTPISDVYELTYYKTTAALSTRVISGGYRILLLDYNVDSYGNPIQVVAETPIITPPESPSVDYFTTSLASTNTLAITINGTLYYWDYPYTSTPTGLASGESHMQSGSISADGNTIVSSGYSVGIDPIAYLFTRPPGGSFVAGVPTILPIAPPFGPASSTPTSSIAIAKDTADTIIVQFGNISVLKKNNATN
jgi:hypothetical protein